MGYLRDYGNSQAHKGTCEFWMPLGWIDSIIRAHRGSQFVADRSWLLYRMLRQMRIRDSVLLDEFAFQVLQVDIEGQPCYFWHANQKHSKLVHWTTGEAHARRQAKRQDWQQRHSVTYPYQDYRTRTAAQGAGDPALPPPPPAPTVDAWAGYSAHKPPGQWGSGSGRKWSGGWGGSA